MKHLKEKIEEGLNEAWSHEDLVPNIKAKIFSELEAYNSSAHYWQKRCLLAEKCLDESPCDPDITEKQIIAHNEYDNFLEQNSEQEISIKILYEQWCKQTKRKGNILIGGSINEFFEWLEPNPTQE